MQLKWLGSYETLKFDTVDGDLAKDQYAQIGNVYLVRTKSKLEDQWDIVDIEDFTQPQIDQMIAGKTLVNVLPGEKMYYDEFLLDDNTKYRSQSDNIKYKDLEKKNAKGVEIDLTKKQIDDIKVQKLAK